MEELLKYILENIIDHPEDVKIEVSESEFGFVNLKFSLNPEDMGRVIGKKGKIITSIRKIMKIKAIKLGKRFNLELIDPLKTD